jgi:cell cycle protein kinase DBF2
MPMPPPLLHTRSGNALYDGPSTPTGNGFTTPYATPQGSPSKSKLPPGAKDLPNVFENAMVLSPSSPTKASRQQLAPHSPNKGGRQGIEESLDDSGFRQEHLAGPGSPLRKSDKENTSPAGRIGKDAGYTNHAAISRQEAYQSRELSDASTRGRYSPTRGLTAEELEKLQLPKVKRLANVTQICK